MRRTTTTESVINHTRFILLAISSPFPWTRGISRTSHRRLHALDRITVPGCFWATGEISWGHSGLLEGIPPPIVAVCSEEKIVIPTRRASCVLHRILHKIVFFAWSGIFHIGTCPTDVSRIGSSRTGLAPPGYFLLSASSRCRP